ncbi:MAG TPA: 30S ribosomal protein S4e [Candidatus Nanoarchaeia archaeon]|nr:30S ribosomal protein S4e [Candidatus Nanoarchaeia archaeon]
MVKNHMKRLAAPKTWLIKRKEGKWVTKPTPGTHKLKKCVPLMLIIRDYLGYANTAKEVRAILYKKDVMINNIFRNDASFPVGLMDIITIQSLKENYILLFNKKGKLVIKRIDNVEVRLIQLENKCYIRDGKKQLNFNDGTNILVDDFSKDCVGDSYLINLIDKKIKHILHLEKKSLVYFTEGINIGRIGRVKEIIDKNVICEIDEREYRSEIKKILVLDDYYKNLVEGINK